MKNDNSPNVIFNEFIGYFAISDYRLTKVDFIFFVKYDECQDIN